MKTILISCCLLLVLFVGIEGHAILFDPIGRSSRWRTNSSAPHNYDDYGNYCGGFGVQWKDNGGKCGLCGDSYNQKTPRPNELGGIFGEGVIVANYKAEEKIDVVVKVSANHLGYVFFEVCNLDEFKNESEECFSRYRLLTANGSDRYDLGTRRGDVKIQVFLPKHLNCKHCVLRWTYKAGNQWGPCKNGQGGLGCGPQEHFKQCADISISGNKSNTHID